MLAHGSKKEKKKEKKSDAKRGERKRRRRPQLIRWKLSPLKAHHL